MATNKELKAVKQELINKAPLIYQGEIYNLYGAIRANKDNLKSPYTIIDLKLAIYKEALAIWEGKESSKQNIFNLLKDKMIKQDILDEAWASLNTLKKGEPLGIYVIEGYTKRKRAMPEIFEDSNQEITQLETERDTAKSDLSTKTTELTTANNSITTLTNEKIAVEKELKTWTDVFGNLNPQQVKAEYDKFKEEHTADQSKKPKPELKKPYDKILLLLERNQNIQQLKEELKDKVLLTASKKELLENWSKYKRIMFIYQASAGEFALLWVNSEKNKNMLYYFMDDKEKAEKAKNEINRFLRPDYVSYWHASNPDKNLTYTGFLAIGAAEKMLSLVKSDKKLNLGDDNKDQGESNYAYDWVWPLEERIKLQNDLQKDYDNIDIEGPFLTYLHTRPVFSNLCKEIKKLNSRVDLLHITDDKNEFLKNLSEHRFNILLWESKDGYWSVLWTQYRDKFNYYTDTDEELEVLQEEAQIKKFIKEAGENPTRLFSLWGSGNSEEGKTKQGFATAAIETILKRIKDNPKLAISEKLEENRLNLSEGSTDKSQKEYDTYLEQLNQKGQKIEQISQIEVKPKS